MKLSQSIALLSLSTTKLNSSVTAERAGGGSRRDLKKRSSSSKKSGKKSSKSSSSMSGPREVCLVKGLEYDVKGVTTPQTCNTISPLLAVANPNGVFEIEGAGGLIINGSNAQEGLAATNCQVPFQFESVGAANTGALCIENTCATDGTCADQKGIVQFFVDDPATAPVSITELDGMQYSFAPVSCPTGVVNCPGEAYLNVYTSLKTPNSPLCFFYNCKFDFVPPTGATGTDFTTFTIGLDTPFANVVDPNDGAPPPSPCLCPANIKNAKTLREVRAAIAMDSSLDLVLGTKFPQVLGPIPQYTYALNVGDTGGSENGLKVCYDDFSFRVGGKDAVVFNFEPSALI